MRHKRRACVAEPVPELGELPGEEQLDHVSRLQALRRTQLVSLVQLP